MSLLIQYNICLLFFPEMKVTGIYNSSAQLQEMFTHSEATKTKFAAALNILFGTRPHIQSAPWNSVHESSW